MRAWIWEVAVRLGCVVRGYVLEQGKVAESGEDEAFRSTSTL